MHYAFVYLLSRQMPSARDVEVTRWRGPTRRATGTSTARALHPRKGRCGDRRGGAENAPSIISFIAFSIIARASSLTAQAHWSTACTERLVYLPRVPLRGAAEGELRTPAVYYAFKLSFNSTCEPADRASKLVGGLHGAGRNIFRWIVLSRSTVVRSSAGR